jgi:hypothetical protein
MGRKKREGAPRTAYKVYGFMVNPHSLLIISQDGQRLAQVEVDSDVTAKEKFMSETLNQQLIATLGHPDFSTIWTDDPAGDPEVVEACRKMEQGQADQLLSDAMTDEGVADDRVLQDEAHQEEDMALLPKPNNNGEISIHTIGAVFQVDIDGVFKNIPGQLLKIDDVCRVFGERAAIDETLYRVVASPINSGSGDNDYLIQLKKIDTWSVPELSAKPQFQPAGKTKVIEVEVPETYTEAEIKRLVRSLQMIKAEAGLSAANYREQIKDAEKAVFEACNGKSYKPMECAVENDWEAGVRRYIRSDTGEVAKEEKIPWEERQLNMNQELVSATPKPELQSDNSENLGAERSTASEAIVDKSALTPDVAAEAQTAPDSDGDEIMVPIPDDFPPPDEDEMEDDPEGEIIDVA